MNLLIDKGKAGYNETLAKMNAQADLQTRVNEQLGTLKNLWDAASGTFTSAMTNFGAAIAPELKQVVTGLTDMTEKLGAWSKENPQLSNAIITTIAISVILLAAFSALSLALVTLLGPMALLRLTFGVLGAKGFGLINIIKLIGSAFMWLGKGIFFVGHLMMANHYF
ncbi:phage tail tape measure protein [Acinetobacter johnsonii]|uniref:phage tail tape measure protein n=1 Tax=Acinetobacter johnsonii TaxID=40214 RepID=UPI003D172CB0